MSRCGLYLEPTMSRCGLYSEFTMSGCGLSLEPAIRKPNHSCE